MGAIRWTAKGMKLAGQILDSEDVEKWLEAKGQAFLEARLMTLPAKWLAGESRARRSLRKEIVGAANRSDVLRSALEEHLGKLPDVLLEVAEKIRYGPPETHESNYKLSVVACPRGLILNLYSQRVVNALRESAELERYEGLPELSLSRRARLSEQAYFDESDRPDLSSKACVVGTDDDFAWELFNLNGHYYVGLLSYSEKLSDKKSRGALNQFVASNLKNIKVRLGQLNAKQLSDLRQRILAL